MVLAFVLAASGAGAAPIRNKPPVNTALPTITGMVKVGKTLTATTGSWTGQITGYAYQWLKCDGLGAGCTLLAGQTAATHTITPEDSAATFRVVVTALSQYGNVAATSAATRVVPSTTVTPAPAPAPTPTPTPVAQASRFGFAPGGNLHNLSSTDLARYLDGAKAAHAGWLRVDVNWALIQGGGPTSYNWTSFDNVMRAITDRGMHALAAIMYAPAWARPAGSSGSTPPSDLAAYARFASATAARYAPMGVHAYEIWNEPNIVNFWAPGPDPARYTQMLKLSYSAIKAADPSAVVVSAGLSPYGSYGQSDAQHMNPISFLERMYNNGASGSFDAVGWHPYNFPYGIGYAPWSAWSQMSETAPSARSVMVANGRSEERRVGKECRSRWSPYH